MVESRLDIKQSSSRDLLDQVAVASTNDGDTLLRSINNELTPPLRMTLGGTHSISIESLTIQNVETLRNRIIPPISNLLPFDFGGATVTIPATNNNNITNDSGGPAVLLNIPASNYVRIGISINSLGQILVTLGLPSATIADATAPAVPGNTFGIGHVIVFNNAGTIDDVVNSDIFQYVGGGGGGGGSGDANVIETAIRDQLLLSPYKGATPIIFSVDEDDLVDGTSTGGYSTVTGTYDLEDTEIMLTKQMLDANEFLGQEKDIYEADVTIYWSPANVDTGATYRISRDGGLNWETLDMERTGNGTITYYGTHKFADPINLSALDTETGGALDEELNATTAVKVSQTFSHIASAVVHEVDVEITVNGSPEGTLCVLITKDDGGEPGDILSKSEAIDITALSTGTLTVPVGNAVLIPGDTYHFVIQTDDTYKSSFSTGVTSIELIKDATNDGLSRQSSAGTWTDSGTEGLDFTVNGRPLDLRVEVTGSATTGKIEGVGIFYDTKIGSVISGIANFDRADFQAVADNLSSFTINFTPDPDLLDVYYVQAGQVFKSPLFQIQGQTIVFDDDFFNNGGVEKDITLLFMQAKGSSFDNSDRNALVLSENHLGSEDPAYDRSQTGRGVKIRNAAGLLREIALDEDDNIIIYELP